MIIQKTSGPQNTGTISELEANPKTPTQQSEMPVVSPNGGTQKVQPSPIQPSSKQLRDAVDQVNNAILSLSRDVQFTVDKETGKEVVKVVDRETNDVIRQIPSEEMLSIAKRIDELQGLIIRQKA